MVVIKPVKKFPYLEYVSIFQKELLPLSHILCEIEH